MPPRKPGTRRTTPAATATVTVTDLPARRTPGRSNQNQNKQTAKQAKEAPLAMVETDVEIVVESLAASGRKAPINIILHGPSGHGKTLLAGGAFAGTRRGVFLSTETEGIASARAIGSKADLIRAPSWEYCTSGVQWAEKNLGLDDWLVVDSGNVMQEMYMRWILERENRVNPLRDLDIPAIQNHQKYQNGFKRWAARLIAGQYNVIFITASMTTEDAEGEPRVIPLLLGKGSEISDTVSSQFSVAIYYAVARESKEMTGEVTRRALFQPHPPWYAKNRYHNALGKTWDVPENSFLEMGKILDKIEDSIKRGETESGAEATGAGRPVASRPVRSERRMAGAARRQAS